LAYLVFVLVGWGGMERVNGHWEIRLGGLVFSGLAATSFPGWWPRVLPAGGG
jgi:hypothetical protein